MSTDDHVRAVELLQQLGMKTYEAECFAALYRIPSGTAREVSDVADVPRTRVYDATASLAEQGFIEVQHTNPQRFRAVPLEEGVAMLREAYERRTEELHRTLSALHTESDEREPTSQEVWALSRTEALDARILEYLEEAETSAVLMLGDERCWSDSLASTISEATDRDVRVTVCAPEPVADAVDAVELEADLGSDGLDGLAPDSRAAGGLGRLLLVDDARLLVSSIGPPGSGGDEHAVLADGERNGAVVLSRHLIAEAVGDVPKAE